MATELTPLEDAAALIALQLTQQLMGEVSMNAHSVINTFNTVYWGVLETLNPNAWTSTESDARASQEGAERAAEPK